MNHAWIPLLIPLLQSTVAPVGSDPPLPPVSSISALAFGPEDVLFIGDSRAGLIHAVRLGARKRREEPAQPQLLDVEAVLGAALGAQSKDVLIHDLAADVVTQDIYLAVSRGRARQAHHWQVPNDVAAADILVRVTPDLAIEVVEVDELERSVASLPNPVEDRPHAWKPDTTLRGDSITDMEFVGGELLVSGLSNEEFAAALWRLPYPFDGTTSATTLEIFHGAHGEYETYAPIRAFVPYELNDEPHVLAAYLCTPFVTFPTRSLVGGEHVRGRTVAELGSGNYPVDMIQYASAGEDRILIANSNLPMMILRTADIAGFEGEITTEPETYVAGVPYEFRSGTGVLQMDLLNPETVVVLQRVPQGRLELFSWPVSRF